MTQYLVCDLDESLVKTDTLYEQWLLLLKLKPALFLKSLTWLLRGKAFFKQRLAEETPFHPERLLYRQDILTLIKDYRTEKRCLTVLASASPTAWTEAVSNHLNLFDIVIGSNNGVNLKSHKKLEALRDKIGASQFSYIGDCDADLVIWKESSEIIAVNPNRYLKSQIKALNKPTKIIEDKVSQIKLILKQIRPHQWVKNILVFLPALAGHKLFDAEVMLKSVAAFGGFSCLASFVYVFNDLLDIGSDRNHHSKKNRPFASGSLSVKWGILLLPVLFLFALSFASILPIEFLAWIATYFLLNIAYSFYIKQQVILDIITLSMMYTLRIFAGSGATGIPISEWLLSFSTFFFFGLACIKRYTEIVRSKNKITLDGRGYRQVDFSIIDSLGVGSGLLSILVILLYLQSKDVRSLYSHPERLWYLTPVLLFWISRMWLLTNRDQIHDDPVVFAVKDKTSWACALIFVIITAVSI